jgi:hypothetical protein
MGLLYCLFTKYGIMPHQYYERPAGERLMMLAFTDYYFKEARS